jgi:hypothetical protein
MTEKEVIEKFLAFAEQKGVSLGGDVVYGFAFEHTEFRPMKKEDYPVLIADFLKILKEEKP